MCGIVGFNGYEQAAPILLEGLTKLEYRGYDSAGLAVRNDADDVELVKAKGRLRALYEKTNGGIAMQGTCGIGHTRWATHGEPNENNAHPHCSDDRSVVAVHNGIIENYKELQEKGVNDTFEAVLEDMEKRDYNDSHRATAPLKQADDAVLADTSDLNFEESLELLQKIVRDGVK